MISPPARGVETKHPLQTAPAWAHFRGDRGRKALGGFQSPEVHEKRAWPAVLLPPDLDTAGRSLILNSAAAPRSGDRQQTKEADQMNEKKKTFFVLTRSGRLKNCVSGLVLAVRKILGILTAAKMLGKSHGLTLRDAVDEVCDKMVVIAGCDKISRNGRSDKRRIELDVCS